MCSTETTTRDTENSAAESRGHVDAHGSVRDAAQSLDSAATPLDSLSSRRTASGESLDCEHPGTRASQRLAVKERRPRCTRAVGRLEASVKLKARMTWESEQAQMQIARASL